MSLESAKAITQIASSFAGIVAAFWALYVYRSNSRRERARWAEAVYERFYERAELKVVREKLDCIPGDTGVAQLVAEEIADLTDYLNFFEFVAYLESSRQLATADVEALFNYYLGCLKKHREVAAYIQDHEKGFEHLRKILFHA